jgi:hypothetical protein
MTQNNTTLEQNTAHKATQTMKDTLHTVKQKWKSEKTKHAHMKMEINENATKTSTN